jgi:thioredoxin 1
MDRRWRADCRFPLRPNPDAMTADIAHPSGEPMRAEIDALAGVTLLEFGTSWCGHCRAARPFIAAALAAHRWVRHVKVEDGSGQPLGRSFGVKLWPTLVFLVEGQEVARLVRPRNRRPIDVALDATTPPA